MELVQGPLPMAVSKALICMGRGTDDNNEPQLRPGAGNVLRIHGVRVILAGRCEGGVGILF
jgi:hypothetical protein